MPKINWYLAPPDWKIRDTYTRDYGFQQGWHVQENRLAVGLSDVDAAEFESTYGDALFPTYDSEGNIKSIQRGLCRRVEEKDVRPLYSHYEAIQMVFEAIENQDVKRSFEEMKKTTEHILRDCTLDEATLTDIAASVIIILSRKLAKQQ
jgi:hypothetical protein